MEIYVSLSKQEEPPIVTEIDQKAPRINDNSKVGQVFDVHVLQQMSYLDMKNIRGDAGAKYAKAIADWLNSQRSIDNKFRVSNRSKISIAVKNTQQMAARYRNIYLLSPESNKDRCWLLVGEGPHDNKQTVEIGRSLQMDVLYASVRTMLASHLPTDEWPGDNTYEHVQLELDKRGKHGGRVAKRHYTFAKENENTLITMMQDGLSIAEITDWVLKQ